VSDAWLPGAGRLHTRHDGGPLQGGAPRAVWHTSENDPLMISARSVAYRLEQRGSNAHVVWNPFTGEIMQLVPATQAALLLPEGIGREGRRCFQIVVVGFASEPFTDGAMKGIGVIVDWLDAWQVPRRWPAGEPLPPPESYNARQERRRWARGGHFGVSQVPYAPGPGPGAIDVNRITGREPPPGVPQITAGEMTLPGNTEGPRSSRLMSGAVPAPVPPPEPAHVRASSPT
jgi:hypothetical protein